jgi:hypothetical protein
MVLTIRKPPLTEKSGRGGVEDGSFETVESRESAWL